MRMKLLMLLLLPTVFSGCQTARNSSTTSVPTEVQRPVPMDSPRTSVTPAPTVMPAKFEEAILLPAVEPETLPSPPPKLFAKSALTLVDFEQMAISSNPSVARAASLVQAARGNWIQVGLMPNPNFGYEGQQIGSHGLAEQDGVFVSQEIVRGGKLNLNRQIAAQECSRAEQELAVQQQRVLTDVRIAFHQVLISQKQEQFTQELLGSFREGSKIVDDLRKGKEVGRVDVVQSQLETENAEILAVNARNRRLAAWQGLAAVIGQPHLPLQELNGNIDEHGREINWDDSLQQLLNNSPEIAAAMSNIERARWAVQRALVEKIPNVTVQGLVNWRDNGIGGGSDAGVTVSVPLGIWDRNQGRVIQTQNEAVAAERALEQLRLGLQKRLAPIFEQYSNALHQSKRYRTKILPAAEESLKLTRKLYEAGEVSYINLLTAQRTYSQMNLSYLESLRELRTAEANIEGLLLSGSLENR